MAQATLETTEVQVITHKKQQVINLQLSIDEAAMLLELMQHIGGDPDPTISPRGMADNIGMALFLAMKETGKNPYLIAEKFSELIYDARAYWDGGVYKSPRIAYKNYSKE